MAAGGADQADGKPIAGQLVHVVGRAHGITQARLERLVVQHGGSLARRMSAKVTLVVVAHSATAIIEDDGTIRLPYAIPEQAALIGECELRRRLGLLADREPVEQAFAASDLERTSGLPASVLACLVLFDVLEPTGDGYAYRDLLAAREVRRLRDGGVGLGAIVEAAVELRRSGQRLTDARLVEAPSGRLFHNVAGTLAELSGQLTMSFGGDSGDIDEEFRAAEAAERDGDLVKAESLYGTLMRADQSDPVLPFNLGNVLRAQGRTAQAKVAWQMAVARDPGFAEAWYNLALASEEEGQQDLAVAQYRRATQARPDYDDAHFNLALMLTRADRFAEAMPVWDIFLGLEPNADQARIAKRAAALCRMQLSAESSKAG
jgi:tetratricopeptide (TPR) repeat protein